VIFARTRDEALSNSFSIWGSTKSGDK
jgi:hypothetical protein